MKEQKESVRNFLERMGSSQNEKLKQQEDT
jgi:hypothetical protein